jgi:hypothetical protein
MAEGSFAGASVGLLCWCGFGLTSQPEFHEVTRSQPVT